MKTAGRMRVKPSLMKTSWRMKQEEVYRELREIDKLIDGPIRVKEKMKQVCKSNIQLKLVKESEVLKRDEHLFQMIIEFIFSL